MKLTRVVLALALGATGLVMAAVTPAAAAPASASGQLDYDDQSSGSIGDYDLTYTVQVSNTTPAAGENVTVNLTWDEVNADPWGYQDVNICWDAPAGWAGAGGAPSTQDYNATTPQDTPTNGQVVGTDVPATPAASANFNSSAAVNERVDVTSYSTGAGRVYRFCAHADKIDSRGFLNADTLDNVQGSMAITLEAPQAGPAEFRGLLPTAAYVGDATFFGGTPRRHPSPLDNGYGLPEDGTWEALVPPRSPGSLSQTVGGQMGVVRYDYAGDGDGPSGPITVTPSGTLLTYSLHDPPDHGQAIVNADGTWNYLPAGGYVGQDSFVVKIHDGDGFSLSTVNVDVTPGTLAMSLTKSAEETSVLVGEPIHYSMDVKATGSIALHDVVVSDPNAPNCDQTVELVPAGQTETVTCTYTPAAGDVGTYRNTASATAEDLEDPVSSNEVEVEVEAAATPRLEIHKSSTQTQVEAGGTIAYEVEVTNSGGVPLTGVAVTDPNAPDCARTVGNLAIGATVVHGCTLATTGAMVGSRTNVATADSNETAPVASETVVVQVHAADGTSNAAYQCPNVPVVGTVNQVIPVTGEDDVDPAEPGQAVTWNLRVANPSIGEVPLEVTIDWMEVEFDRPANLTDVTLQLVNPPGGTANPPTSQATPTVTATKVRFRVPNSGDVTVGTNGSLTYNGAPVVLPQIRITGKPTEAARGTTIQWRAPKVTINISTLGIGQVICNPTSTVNVVQTRVNAANPILDIDKSSVQQAAMPGQTVDYELLVRNRGNVGLTGVSVTDAVAPDCDTAVGALAAGASQTIDCSRAVVAGDVGRLRNLAIVDSDQTGPVTSNPADVLVGTEAVAGLDVDLEAAAPAVEAGDPVAWTITAQNTGNTPLTGVTLDADDASDCDEQAIGSTIAIGATLTVECATPTVDLLQAFDVGGSVSNQATVGTTETGPLSSDEVTVAVTIPPSGWQDLAAWYAAAGDWMDFWDLADGFQDGTQFRGNRSITRGEFLRMVWRLAGEPVGPNPPTHSFTDVPAWIAPAVAWATDDPAGDEPPLMTGLTPTRFGATESITRGQAVRLLFRFADRLDPQTVPSPPTHAFTDVPAWVAEPVAWAANDPDGDGPLEPLVTGLSPTRFGANADITRAQVARILYRLSDLLDL